MRVVVGIITDALHRILITQRASHLALGGFWEFPGGKLEMGESPREALRREIKEETGLDVLEVLHLGSLDDDPVTFEIFHVYHHQGVASCLESQTGLRWVGLDQLQCFEFPAINMKMIDLYCKISQVYPGLLQSPFQ